MNKFKIGDRVKIKKSNYTLLCDWGKIFRIDKIQKLGEFKYSCYNSFTLYFREEDLELVETSEEIAVKKFKEELKNKINKLIKKLEKSLVKLTNTDRAYQQGKIEQLRELLKLL